MEEKIKYNEHRGLELSFFRMTGKEFKDFVKNNNVYWDDEEVGYFFEDNQFDFYPIINKDFSIEEPLNMENIKDDESLLFYSYNLSSWNEYKNEWVLNISEIGLGQFLQSYTRGLFDFNSLQGSSKKPDTFFLIVDEWNDPQFGCFNEVHLFDTNKTYITSIENEVG